MQQDASVSINVHLGSEGPSTLHSPKTTTYVSMSTRRFFEVSELLTLQISPHRAGQARMRTGSRRWARCRGTRCSSWPARRLRPVAMCRDQGHMAGEGAGHRGRVERAWACGDPHVRGPRHRVRHHWRGNRRFLVHGGVAAPGGEMATRPSEAV